jgi:hypothetical protein
MRYFIGLLLVAVGVGMVLKTEWIISNFGSSAWAEEKFGTSGGSRMMYKVIGIVLIFFGFLSITNMIQGFLIGTVGRILIR